MTDHKYDIYFQGLKPGVAAEDAVINLIEVLKLPKEKAEKLIHSKPRVIKAGLSMSSANKYYASLDKIGLHIEIRDEKETIISKNPEQEINENITPSDQSHTLKNESIEPSNQSQTIPVEFNGQAFEYFKIWIVNIFLTIVTLGIYSAWAKVRNKQYFYGNTIIDGSSFNYTAKPISILKGRLIAVGLFAIFSVVSEITPMIGLAMMLAFLPIVPWLITRSLAFNARNSMYRNIRFDFKGSYGEAFSTFLLWPLLIIFTLGLILPYIWYKQNRFINNNSAYGTTEFEFHAEPKEFYRVFLIALGGLLVTGLVIFGLYTFVSQEIMMIVGGLIMAPVYISLFGYFTASLGNLNFNSTTLEGHHFTSSMQSKTVAWIFFTNTLAIALTLGLMIPWAQVRMARYRAECLQLEANDSLDEFIAAEQKNVSALGDQMGEVFDIEMSAI